MRSSSNSVLVSGASGFVMRAVVEELAANGYHVIALDKHAPESCGTDFGGWLNSDRVRFVQQDATDTVLLDECLRDAEHFIAGAAVVGGVGFAGRNSYEIWNSNHRLAMAMLESSLRVMRLKRFKRLTFISSSVVYEQVGQFPAAEGDEADGRVPRSSYALQKLTAEAAIRFASAQYGLEYTVIRPFNCIGPGPSVSAYLGTDQSRNQAPARWNVAPDLARRILGGEYPLRLYGGGDQVRNFIDVRDVARGIRLSLSARGVANDTFNLTTGTPVRIRELAQIIFEKVRGDVPFKIESNSSLAGDSNVNTGDPSKAEAVLGFAAAIPLEDSVEQCIDWVRSYNANVGDADT